MAEVRNPQHVKKQLRKEVGFGCPVSGCGNPYLTYHHFDPEWHIEQHNDPARMIALCRQHHDKAAAFSIEECREMKRNALARAAPVQGRFDWMKRDIVAIAGGNAYLVQCVIRFGDQPLIWFNRDDENHQLLNIHMPPDSNGKERTSLVDNDWVLRGDPLDVASPPNGAELDIRYGNGDKLYIRFRSLDAAGLEARYPYAVGIVGPEAFPITTVEVNLALTAQNLELTPTGLTVSGHGITTSMRGCILVAPVGIQIGTPQHFIPAAYGIE